MRGWRDLRSQQDCEQFLLAQSRPNSFSGTLDGNARGEVLALSIPDWADCVDFWHNQATPHALISAAPPIQRYPFVAPRMFALGRRHDVSLHGLTEAGLWKPDRACTPAR